MLLTSLLVLQASLSTSPPERMLADYLRAFNERDGGGLPAFLRERFEWPKDHPEAVEGFAAMQAKQRRTTGGYDLRRIRALEEGRIVADVQSRRLGTWSHLSLFLAAEPPNYKKPTLPHRIVGMGMGDEAAPEPLLSRRPLKDAEIAQRLGRLMSLLVADDAFSGAVLVARNGRPVFARAYGLASRSYNVPNTLAMRFNLASITKMFTAVAVNQLVEAGKLAYDDPVGKILPNYPNADVAKRVTVRHLLTHTSGLIGARALVEKGAPPPKERTVAALLPAFVSEPLSFAPGERFEYSNAGFELLGRIVEKTSGQDYYDYLREHVFGPAGMTQSGFFDLDVPRPNLATGYEDGLDGTRLDNVFALAVRGGPAGGAYATAGDMDRFARAMLSGRLVRKETLDRMWSGAVPTQEEGVSYGFGAFVERYHGLRIVSHGGGWRGVTDQFEVYPDLGITVTILGNTDSEPKAIAYKVRELFVQGRSFPLSNTRHG